MTSITDACPAAPKSPRGSAVSTTNRRKPPLPGGAELDLPGFDQLDLEDIEEWYDTHGIRTYETFLFQQVWRQSGLPSAWDKLDDAQKSLVRLAPSSLIALG